jgi:hypothetical protein
MPKPCRQEFRDDVVKVARSRPEGATLKQLAADFGIHSMTLSKWFRQAAVDDGDRPGVTTTESVGDGIPVTVSCRVLQFARAAHHRWLNAPFTDDQLGEAWLANAIFDAHRDDPEFGYRFLADEPRQGDHSDVPVLVVWRICLEHGWGSRQTQASSGAQTRHARSRWPGVPGLHRCRAERVLADRYHCALDA